MKSREEFFKLVLTEANLAAHEATKYSVDLDTLMGHGLSEPAARELLQLLRPLSENGSFEKFLEGSFVRFFEGVLLMVDGLSAYAVDSPHQFKVVDESGESLGEDLHFDFGMFLKDHPL